MGLKLQYLIGFPSQPDITRLAKFVYAEAYNSYEAVLIALQNDVVLVSLEMAGIILLELLRYVVLVSSLLSRGICAIPRVFRVELGSSGTNDKANRSAHSR